MMQGIFHIQEMSNGDVFYARVEGQYKNGSYAVGVVDCYVGCKASRVKKSRINNTSLWEPTETVPEDVQARFDAL
jgi:hypothetical protein